MRRSPIGTVARLALGAVLAVTASTLAVTPAQAGDGRRVTAADAERPARSTPQSHRAAVAAAGKVRLAIELDPAADPDDVVAAARANGAEVRHRIPQIRVVSVEVAAAAADKVAAALSRRPGVRAVRPVASRSTGFTPDDTSFAGSQTYLADVNAPAAWDITKGSADVLIAVIDSGVDVAHPDLAGKIAGAYNADTGTSTVTDNNGHGTFVAGVAAAATNNATGIAGAGFDSRLLAVKVDDADGGISTDTEAAGIVWAVDNGADVMNISLGGEIDATEQAAVEYALAEGVVVVASAGNEFTDVKSYPAAYDGVIAVGATNGASRSAFSNFGTWVDVGAPGENIRSTTPTAGSENFPASYATGAGTSFSSPLVAGEVALLRAADPLASLSVVRNAVTSATTGSYGFANGRVDFAAAFSFLPPTSLPTWTLPAESATVSGDVDVAATSDAQKVKFAVAGGPSTTVNTVTGAASGTLETFGLSGAKNLFAYDCNTAGCNTNGVARPVTVDNGVPTITSPTAGTEIGTSTFAVTATTPAGQGGVKFLVDGASKGFDATAPYGVTVNASALTSGGHTLTAVLCNRAGTICDTANPSASVAFVVNSLHPKLTRISPNPFSPNGDRVLDSAVVTYTVDVTQNVRLQIKNSSGTVVRGPGALGPRPAGTSTWTWNGRRNDGSVAPDGTYTVELLTSAGGRTGFASAAVRLDNTRPNMASPSGNGATFYPVKDSYKDTFSPAITVGETARLVLTVFNSAGSRVRTIDNGVRGPGRYAVTWNGRRADGSMVPAGTYRYTFTASDAARNTRTTGRYTVYVSAKKLASRVAQETLSPFGTVVTPYIGECSAVFYDVRGWTGSLGWRSNFTNSCVADQVSDLALTEHSFAMKSAVKYGNVRVAATGQGVSGHPGNGLVMYLDKSGEATDWGANLGASYGTYWGVAVNADKIRDGRVISWIAGTAASNWWDARSFTVKYVYYVLV